MKYAAYNGNYHCAVRVTAFFESREEARKAAPVAQFVRECANWEEHIMWNLQRVGNYASCPVSE